MSKEQFELAKLISRYLQGTLSAEEETEFLARAAHDNQLGQLLAEYKSTDSLAENIAFIEEIDQEDDWNKILKKSQNRFRKKTHYLRKWKWVGIAASFIGLCGMIWWQLASSPSEGIVPDRRYGYTNDVLPGNKKAILTLANGKQISLEKDDSLQLENGIIHLIVNKEVISYQVPQNNTKEEYNIISTPKGGTYFMNLPDGSKVWLNAESVLKFPVSFTQGERSVKLLAGEAYFEVAQQAAAPFTVGTNGLDVEVLGTAFNINAYSKERTKTILTEGKIRVKRGNDCLVIEPGYAVTALPHKLAVQKIDMEEALSWKDGYFYFEGKDLDQILQEVARWYNVTLVYEEPLNKTRYRGALKRTATLAGVCKMLTDLSGRRFKIEGRTLIVIKS